MLLELLCRANYYVQNYKESIEHCDAAIMQRPYTSNFLYKAKSSFKLMTTQRSDRERLAQDGVNNFEIIIRKNKKWKNELRIECNAFPANITNACAKIPR